MIIPTLCIYHNPCPDGFSAAWAVWKRFGDTIRYHPGIYGDPHPDVSGEDVLLVDFSYSSDVLRTMAASAHSITVLDHHRTAEANLTPLLADQTIHGLFDMDRSGAVITWQYFHPQLPVPDLLLYIQDRDLWQFKLSETRAVLGCVDSYDYSFSTWSWLVEKLQRASGREAMILEGHAIARKHQKDVAQLLKFTTRSMTIDGTEVQVANLPYTMASDGAGQLAIDAPFAASYLDRAGQRVFSLRSRGETGFDVSAIAQRYGGGGHYHAAGFSIAFDDLDRLGLR